MRTFVRRYETDKWHRVAFDGFDHVGTVCMMVIEWPEEIGAELEDHDGPPYMKRCMACERIKELEDQVANLKKGFKGYLS